MTWYRYWAKTRFHVEHAGNSGRSQRAARAAPVPPDPGKADVPPPRDDANPQPPRALSPDGAAPDGAAPRGAAPRGAEGPQQVARLGQTSRTSRTVVIANQKGGVGKTTTAISVSAAVAQQGHRVLLVDLDPQGNASSGLGLPIRRDRPTGYDVVVDDAPAADAVVATGVDGLDVLPSSIDLAGAEIELVSAISREQKLARALSGIQGNYDLVVVDCAPSLGLLTVNALTAGDAVLVPIQCEYYALEGLGSLQQNIELIREHLNPGLQILGYVMTMYDGRTRLSEQVVGEVQRHFGSQVFSTKVPRSVRLAEAPSYGLPITVFDPGSRGAVAYHRVADEMLGRMVAMFDRTTVIEGVAG